MKKLLLVLLVAPILFLTGTTLPVQHEQRINIHIPIISKLTKAKLIFNTKKAIEFLQGCDYFREKWQYAHKELVEDNIDITILVVPVHGSVCGLFIPPDTIVLSKDALDEVQGCYESVTLVIVHELLHYLGLPDHKDYVTEFEYLEKDPIERTINRCVVEYTIKG